MQCIENLAWICQMSFKNVSDFFVLITWCKGSNSNSTILNCVPCPVLKWTKLLHIYQEIFTCKPSLQLIWQLVALKMKIKLISVLKTVFQIVAICMFVFQMQQSIRKFLRYPVVSEISSISVDNIDKPLIYICQTGNKLDQVYFVVVKQ